MRHPAIGLLGCNFCSTSITEQVWAIKSIKAAATTQSLPGIGQVRLDDILDVHNVSAHVLMEERVVFLNSRSERNVGLGVLCVSLARISDSEFLR